MTTLSDHLRALLGAAALADDAALLMATDAVAAKLLRHHGVLYSREAREALNLLAQPTPDLSTETTGRSAYYLGLQVGWRVAQRLR